MFAPEGDGRRGCGRWPVGGRGARGPRLRRAQNFTRAAKAVKILAVEPPRSRVGVRGKERERDREKERERKRESKVRTGREQGEGRREN